MKANCYKTVVPLKRPFSTSRFTSTKSTNYIVEIEDEGSVGVGEAAARGIKLTGDQKSKIPAVVQEMLSVVNGSRIDYTDRCSALDSVKNIYKDLERVAHKNAGEANREKPFRGILSGFDIALLDLCAKKLKVKVSELLGQRRDKAYVSASTLSASKKPDEVIDRLRKQAVKFDAFRCKGAADNGENIARLSLMRKVNQELGAGQIYWLDLNEALSPDEATEFVKLVENWIEEGGGEGETVILEQPVNKVFYKELCELQALCNSRPLKGSGKIVIMADESLWDLEDFKCLSSHGGCGAINIKIPKVGGLLKALELADYVEENSPGTMVYVGGMIGTSDIMGRAIYNLYKSLPRIDFCTTSPARNVSVNLASSPLVYFSKTSNKIVLGDGHGLGTSLNYQALSECLDDGFLTTNGRDGVVYDLPLIDDAINEYENPELLAFSPKELDSHLIEREALLLGLATERVSSTKFTVVDSAQESKVTFYWTMASGLPKKTRLACKHKAVTKEMFRAAGAPVAKGKLFQIEDESKEIISYAEYVGWPVVVKPGVGTGGVGVTANINNAEDLLWAINNIKSSKLASDRNDGTFVLEKHISGKELRVLVAGGKAVGAIERIQPHVVGDGVSTVSQLVARKNNLRSKNPNLSNSKLKRGESAKFQLKRQGKTFKSIPCCGEIVTLSPVFSISQGADSRSVIDRVHPSVLEAAVKAVSGVPDLYETGVDFILQDYTLPIEGQQACICEVNTSPAISSSHFPMYGHSVNVAKEFLLSVLSRKYGSVPENNLEVISNEQGKLLVDISGEMTPQKKEDLCSMLGAIGIKQKIFSSSFSTRLFCEGNIKGILACPSLISKKLSGAEADSYYVFSMLV